MTQDQRLADFWNRYQGAGGSMQRPNTPLNLSGVNPNQAFVGPLPAPVAQTPEGLNQWWNNGAKDYFQNRPTQLTPALAPWSYSKPREASTPSWWGKDILDGIYGNGSYTAPGSGQPLGGTNSRTAYGPTPSSPPQYNPSTPLSSPAQSTQMPTPNWANTALGFAASPYMQSGPMQPPKQPAMTSQPSQPKKPTGSSPYAQQQQYGYGGYGGGGQSFGGYGGNMMYQPR